MAKQRVLLLAALLAFTGSAFAFLAQVDVSDETTGAIRTCGSAFDSAVDRSGWELWWARDLDESNAGVASALTRSRHCPAAVNRSTAIASALAGIGVVLAVLSRPDGRSRSRGRTSSTDAVRSTVGAQLGELGRVTSMVGGVLSAAGVIALVALVADADSTLFLYTDRLVVAGVGLITLVPALVLVALGRVIGLVAQHVDRSDAAQLERERLGRGQEPKDRTGA